MSMNVNVARVRIARELEEAEHAANEAIIAQAKLFSTLVQARRDTEKAAMLGHVELLRLHKSQGQLLDSAGGLAHVHGGLLKIQEAETGFEDCPGGGATKGLTETLPELLQA